MVKEILKKGCIAFSIFILLIFTRPAEAEIILGVAGPHTGPYAAFGEQLWRGAELAANTLNSSGGILGQKIRLVKGDDACEPKQAVAVANRLVDAEKVSAVIGHFCSSSTMPASEIYDEAGILMVTPASTNPMVTDRKLPTIFRVCGRDDQQGAVAANYIIDNLKAKKVAIIHDKDTYGQGLANATREEMNKRGIREVLYEGLTRGEKDFNALVTKIRASKAEVVYFGGIHAEAGPLVRQMREQGLKALFMSGDGIVSDDFLTTAGGKQFVEGVMMTFGADPRNQPAGKDVIKAFRKAGWEPEGYTLYAYTAVQTIAAAFNGSGSTDGIKSARWLRSNTVSSVMGPKKFDSKGDLTLSDYVMYQWKNGKYAEIRDLR